MELNEYQRKAQETAIYPKEIGLIYTTLGLVGEAGELANKVKKIIRDHNGEITEDIEIELQDELGDVLWYVANLAKELNFDLDIVARNNLYKLQMRKNTNTLKGSGDNREKTANIISDIEIINDLDEYEKFLKIK